jgi:hypothetical protein
VPTPDNLLGRVVTGASPLSSLGFGFHSSFLVKKVKIKDIKI